MIFKLQYEIVKSSKFYSELGAICNAVDVPEEEWSIVVEKTIYPYRYYKQLSEISNRPGRLIRNVKLFKAEDPVWSEIVE